MGSRIHETHLYQPGSFPFGLIAPVTIIWKSLSVITSPEKNVPDAEDASAGDAKPKSKKGRRRKGKETVASTEPVVKPGPDTLRTLWIRVHPSAWQEVWDAVQRSASIVLDGVRQERMANVNSDAVQEEGNGEGNSLGAEESIDLMDLRSQINCFELMGPRSSQIIRGAMTLVNGDDRPIFHEVRYYSASALLLTLTYIYSQFWAQLKDLQSPGSVPRGMVISFKVHDPRLKYVS